MKLKQRHRDYFFIVFWLACVALLSLGACVVFVLLGTT